MPVVELVRRLAGAILALIATVTLVLCLAETRYYLGRSQLGLWWLPLRWSFTPRFTSVWCMPLIVRVAVN